jgi:hypothetical protein
LLVEEGATLADFPGRFGGVGRGFHPADAAAEHDGGRKNE